MGRTGPASASAVAPQPGQRAVLRTLEGDNLVVGGIVGLDIDSGIHGASPGLKGPALSPAGPGRYTRAGAGLLAGRRKRRRRRRPPPARPPRRYRAGLSPQRGIGAPICVLGRRLTRGLGRHARPPDRRRRAALSSMRVTVGSWIPISGIGSLLSQRRRKVARSDAGRKCRPWRVLRRRLRGEPRSRLPFALRGSARPLGLRPRGRRPRSGNSRQAVRSRQRTGRRA